ncbi:MAG: VWA domain-containing protein, partial [Pyrinomonadaceae bacterium]
MFSPSAALICKQFYSSVTNIPVINLCTAILLVCVCALSVPGQASTDGDDVIRVSTDLLLFPIRVKDKQDSSRGVDSGRGRTRSEGQVLTQRDLALKDPDHIIKGLYFSAGTDRVALVFALDQSGSLRDTIGQQREAAIALYSHFSDTSSVAVMRFGERPSIVVPFNKDSSLARAAFTFVPARNQHTAIFDAAVAALDMFRELPKIRAERRIVVLISDGVDNASRLDARSVIDAAVEQHVSFYVVHVPLFEPRDGHLAVRAPAKGFRDLAEKTGGKYFLTGDVHSALIQQKTDLVPIFQAIEDDLKSQYLLGFYIDPAAEDGRKHAVSVSVLPPKLEYSVGQLGYSRTHKFSVNLSTQ